MHYWTGQYKNKLHKINNLKKNNIYIYIYKHICIYMHTYVFIVTQHPTLE